MKEYNCFLCQKGFPKEESLIRHLSRKHKVRKREYVLRTHYNGIEPLCECGCGEKVNFNRKVGFRRFMHSHASRVPEIRQQCIDGGRKAAADPEKRKKNSDAIKKKWQDPEYRKKMSEVRNDPTSSYQTTMPGKISAIHLANREHFVKLKKNLWADEEWAAKQRKRLSSREFSEKVSVGTKKAFECPKLIDKLSKAVQKSYLDGNRDHVESHKHSITEWKFNPYANQEEYMHSSWESLFLDQMIEKNIPVTKNHQIKIWYTNAAGAKKLYIPDFYGINSGIIYEIKGYETENDLFKYKAAQEYVESNDDINDFVVLRKKDLFGDGTKK